MLYIKNGEIRDSKKIAVVVDGYRYFNPSESMILADGWQPYTPPTPEQPIISLDEQYKQRVVELIREKYSIDDELSIQRQRYTKPEEFEAYNAFVESCKIQARREIYGDELV